MTTRELRAITSAMITWTVLCFAAQNVAHCQIESFPAMDAKKTNGLVLTDRFRVAAGTISRSDASIRQSPVVPYSEPLVCPSTSMCGSLSIAGTLAVQARQDLPQEITSPLHHLPLKLSLRRMWYSRCIHQG